MKLLYGAELAGYIKERQARQVRALRQSYHIIPKLAIIQTVKSPVVDAYMRLKKGYGEDILIDVDVHTVTLDQAFSLIPILNKDITVHGIIVQLPISDPHQTGDLVNLVTPTKDVDGLGVKPDFIPATPNAILWLLAGFNVDLKAKQILVIGQGRLVGAPLASLLKASGYSVITADHKTSAEALLRLAQQSDIIITATGVPQLITSEMLKQGAVVVDAGVATEADRLVGDVANEVRTRNDLTITPIKGGVGPLTICALFDNVIRAAQKLTESISE